MALSDALCKVLSTGMEKEQAAHDFYVEAAGKTKNPLGRKMFQRLAEDETRHEELLRSWSEQGACPAAAPAGGIDPEFIRKGREKVAEAVQPETGDLEALEFAKVATQHGITWAVLKTVADPFDFDLPAEAGLLKGLPSFTQAVQSAVRENTRLVRELLMLCPTRIASRRRADYLDNPTLRARLKDAKPRQ